MFWEDIFFLFSSGGTPEWPPCDDYVAVLGGCGENNISPESLTTANAFGVNKG